ncbi:hypothetical protein GCM10027093_07710 [Paraburkholderia jirisanensis]
MTREFDVLVVGAGPAGLCAALRLNQLGHRVLVVERSVQWPRPQIGEALTPGVRNIVDYLDANDALATVPLLSGQRTRVRWSSAGIETIAHEGFIVDRAAFDSALLRLAESRGVTVLRPASVIDIHGAARAWTVELAHGDGMQRVHVQALLEAQGRQHRRAPQRLHAARLATMWAEIDLATLPRGTDLSTRVEALPSGWIWGATLPRRRYRVMFTFDPSTRDEPAAREPESILRGACARSLLFGEMAGLRWCEPVSLCVSTPYVDALAWDDGRIKLGDTAFALDPISSSGVEKAMRFSLQAALALNTWSRAANTAEQELARGFYETRLVESAARHFAWTARYYGETWCAGSPFWQQRAMPIVTRDTLASNVAEDEIAAARIDTMSRALRTELARVAATPARSTTPVSRLPLHAPVRFAHDAEIVTMPCATGDRITAQAALRHPNLDRPIAYWDGVALFPLIGALTRSTLPLELMTFLGRSMETASAHKLLEWLWNKRIIESVALAT